MKMSDTQTAPSVGEDGVISETQPLTAILQCFPVEVGGLRKHTAVHSCLDVTDQYLALGAEQGYVWVVDLSSNKLAKEFSEFKGTKITAVKLNPIHDFIAYGNAEGLLRVESTTKFLAKRYTVREKDDKAVGALAWSKDGTILYCGYVSGRLIKFQFQFEKGVIDPTPLLECGSPVVQLAVSGHSLLISTYARSLLLDAESGRLTQVGTKDRKPGSYGGDFSPSEGKAYLARPGLRIWSADESGKVLQTIKFRDALDSEHLPKIPMHSWFPTSPQLTDSWQFTLVHCWLERFLVTLHDRAVWVLDPDNKAVVGVLALEHQITDLTTWGDHIYVLCGGLGTPVVRLTIHPAFAKRLEEEKKEKEEEEESNGAEIEGALPQGAEEQTQKQEEQEDVIVMEELNCEKQRDSDAPETQEVEKETQYREQDTESSQVPEIQVVGSTDSGAVEEEKIPLDAAIDVISDYSENAPTKPSSSGRSSPSQSPNIFRKLSPIPGLSFGKSHSGTTTPPEQTITMELKEKLIPAWGKLSGLLHSPLSRIMHGGEQRAEDNETHKDGEDGEYHEPLTSADGVDQDSGTVSPDERYEPTKLDFMKLGKLGGKLSELLQHRKLGPSRQVEADDADTCKDGEDDKKDEATDGVDLASGTATPEESRESRTLDLRLKLGKLGLRQPAPETPQDALPPTRSAPPVDEKEQERRLRMAETADDDIVVTGKSHKKRKKKKGKKISSRSSSASTSLERLTDIGLEDEHELAIPAFLSAMSTMPPPTALQEGAITEEHPSELTTSGQQDDRRADQMKEAELPTAVELTAEEFTYPTDITPESERVTVEADGTPETLESTEANIHAHAVSETTNLAILLEDTIDKVPPLDTTPSSRDEDLHPGEGRQEPVEELCEEGFLESMDVGPRSPIMLKCSIDETPLMDEETMFAMDIHSQFISEQELPSELSDNPLYQDDTSDNATEVESSQSTEQRHLREANASDPVSINKRSSSRFQEATSSVEQRSEPSGSSGSAKFELSQSPEWTLGTSSPIPSYRFHPHMKKVQRRTVQEREQSREAKEGSGSDSSQENEPEKHFSVFESSVTPDYYKLCGTLVNQRPQEQAVSPRTSHVQPLQPVRQHSSSTDSLEESGDLEPPSGADIWVPIPHPSRNQLQSLCISDTLLWLVDSRDTVFYTPTKSKGRDWKVEERLMHQVASSSSGKIVWGVYRYNAYVRICVGVNPARRIWKNLTKGTFLAQKIKLLAVDENGVWAVRIDGCILFRKGVTESSPEGTVWQEVREGVGFTYVTCCNGVVWALAGGKVFVREGITSSIPSGRKWSEVPKAPKFVAISITADGIVWGIDHGSQMGFRCGATPAKPYGKGPWWQVTISALNHPSSPYNSLWQVMSAEGRQLIESVSSLVTHSAHHNLVAITASAKAGVCVLEANSKLHVCWRFTTGYHYSPACKDGVFQLTTWTTMATGSTGMWLVREDGELYCLARNEKLTRVECASTVDILAASPSSLWVVAKGLIWSRQGMTQELPEGISWDYIELSTQLHEKKLRYITCGKTAVWAIDSAGVPHFRFGVHAREPGTGMSPAWVPVEDNPHPLIQIAVSPDGELVWACDEHYNTYARTGVTQDFPVGRAWEIVQGEKVKKLCAMCGKVYALTPTGELLCRYGISDGNAQGNYWRRMPGARFVHIATGFSGELWTLDDKGSIWKQEWKVLTVSENPNSGRAEMERSMVVDQSWEYI